MPDSAIVHELLTRWFASGDERAHRRAYEHLTDLLYAPPEAIEVLGNGAVDEIRQDVVSRLLDRRSGKLRDASAPVAYARVAWRRDLVTAIRKWGPRLPRESEVEDHLRQMEPRSAAETVEARLDAERAVRIAESLAVLLTTRPDRISDGEWSALIATLPPPPPPRPHAALDREAASCLLYPPQGAETASQRYQRLNSFDKTYNRAIESLRTALGVAP
jgi:DNA-directed RNA polymerase specialized sigma24 family protein